MPRETGYELDLFSSSLMEGQELNQKAFAQAVAMLIDKEVEPENLALFTQQRRDTSTIYFQDYLNWGKHYNPEGLPTLLSNTLTIDEALVEQVLKGIHGTTGEVYFDILECKDNDLTNGIYPLAILEHTLGFTPTASSNAVMKDGYYYEIVSTKEDTIYQYEPNSTVIADSSPSLIITFNPITTYDEHITTTITVKIATEGEQSLKTTTTRVTKTLKVGNLTLAIPVLIDSNVTTEYIPFTPPSTTSSTTNNITAIISTPPDVKTLLGRNHFNMVSSIPWITDTNPNTIDIVRYNMYCYQIKYSLEDEQFDKLHNYVYFPKEGFLSLVPNTYVVQSQGGILPDQTVTQEIELMYPIITLREHHFSLNEYDVQSKDISYEVEGEENRGVIVYRPSTITEDRYDTVKILMSGIKLKLDDLLEGLNSAPDSKYMSDVFITMGFSPKGTSSVIAKLNYLTFEHLYNSSSLALNSNNITFSHSFDLNEGKFNSAFRMDKLLKEEGVGTYTEVGKYFHSLQQKSETYISGYQTSCEQEGPCVTSPIWTTRYYWELEAVFQETETTYVRYIVENLSATTVIRSAHTGSTTESLDQDTLFLPLLPKVVDQLSIDEQYEAMEVSFRLVSYIMASYHIYIPWYEDWWNKILEFLSIADWIISLIFTIVGIISGGVAAIILNLIGWGVKGLGELLDYALSKINPRLGNAIGAYLNFAGSIILGDASGAVEILNIALNLTDFVIDLAQFELAIVFSALEENVSAFRITAEDKLAEIEAVREKYDTDSSLLDLSFLASQVGQPQEKIPTYSMSTLYELTYNLQTNYDLIFESGYASVSNFYDNKLNIHRGI